MEPKKFDFAKGECDGSPIRQGATFNHEITWETQDPLNADNYIPVNLTGYSAKMQVRAGVNLTVLIELSTVNSRIVLGGITGKITLNIDPADTTTLVAGKYLYDLKMISPTGFVSYLLEGKFEVYEEITV